MTQADAASATDSGRLEDSLWESDGESDSGRKINVGRGERSASVAAGALLAALGVSRRSVPGLVVAGVGAALLHRGLTGRCGVYSALGVDTAEEGAVAAARRGVHVDHSFLINKWPEELYRYWRQFENLPRIMSHLKSVTVLDERRSHWVAEAPRLAGGRVEWDAEIVEDQPNERIAWRSLPGADVDNAGHVRFAKAPGDRGTIVHVSVSYLPPAGRVGDWAAWLLGESGEQQIREDLRQFKRVFECGEAATTEGQPQGTCTGK